MVTLVEDVATQRFLFPYLKNYYIVLLQSYTWY